MVGKLDTKNIDKVETPPSYRVESTVETHDQSGKKGQQERKEEDEYSASSGIKGWQKYHTDAKDRRALKIRRRDIAKIFYNQVFLQKGLVIIDADLQLINGQLLRHVHLFSTKIDIYWKLKKLGNGQELPIDELVTEQYAEVSVLHRRKIVKTEGGVAPQVKTLKETKPEMAKEWSLWPLIDEQTKKPNWFAITIYSIIILVIIALMTALF